MRLLEYIPDVTQEGKIHRAKVSVSAGSRNRGMLKVDPKGVQTKDYMKNPVVLWAHDSHRLPIARATKVKSGDVIEAEFEFNPDDEFAMQVEQAWINGFVRAVSIGVDFNYEDVQETKEGLVLSKSNMVEFSIVPMGADMDALKQSFDQAAYQGFQVYQELKQLFGGK